MNEFAERIIEMEDKAKKYDILYNKYNELTKKIQQMVELLSECNNDLIIPKRRTRVSNNKNKNEQIIELYNKMKMIGQYIYMKDIKNEYKDLTDMQANTLWTALKKMKGICKSKNGKLKYLFYDKMYDK